MDLSMNLIGSYNFEDIKKFDPFNNKKIEVKNNASKSKSGSLKGLMEYVQYRPIPSEGKMGNGIEMIGGGYIDLTSEIGKFDRHQPFSISTWLKIKKDSVSGPLFSYTNGKHNGFRGYDCLLLADGSVEINLTHVYPANLLSIVSVEKIAPNKWINLTLNYDGSSTPSGLKVYINGKQSQLNVNIDNLQSTILNGKVIEWGQTFHIGSRDSESIKDIVFDEFFIYDRALSNLEIDYLFNTKNTLQEAINQYKSEQNKQVFHKLYEYYSNHIDLGFQANKKELFDLRKKENDLLSKQPEVMVMKEMDNPRSTFILARGQYDAPTEEVSPATPESILAFPDDLPRNRLGLAQWLFDENNPIASRVVVNRYWQMYFGQGLVKTTDDFGNQGALPSHPELLDHLAVKFRALNWNIKAMQKYIIMSATYRQSSVSSKKMFEKDPENLWLSRGPSYRMPSEHIRDNALAASGLLVRKVGGPSVKPYQPKGLWKELATRNVTEYEQGTGDDLYRRSMYTFWKRSSPPPSMISFDAPERGFCIVKRQKTNTPLQALVLLNDPQYVEASRVLSEKVIKESNQDVDLQISIAFRLLTSRNPNKIEIRLLKSLYTKEEKRFLENKIGAKKLVSIGAYPRDEDIDISKLAAMTVVTNTIMNYDEAVFKR